MLRFPFWQRATLLHFMQFRAALACSDQARVSGSFPTRIHKAPWGVWILIGMLRKWPNDDRKSPVVTVVLVVIGEGEVSGTGFHYEKLDLVRVAVFVFLGFGVS
jgi:hypothetical protein